VPGGIKFVADTTYTFTVTAFDGVKDSAAATATFKTGPQLLYIYNSDLQYDKFSVITKLNDIKIAEQKLPEPKVTEITCSKTTDICSLVIDTHSESYQYNWDGDQYNYNLDKALDLTKNHTFEVQILSDTEYDQQQNPVAKNQESEWAKYNYVPSINSFSISSTKEGSNDTAKLDLSWVDQSYNKDTDEYKLIQETITNQSWAKCIIDASIETCSKTLGYQFKDFSEPKQSDISLYGSTQSVSHQSINKYDEAKIRIQRCVKDSDICYPKSEYVYYHPTPIITVDGDKISIIPFDKDPSKIKNYTISYRLTGTKEGIVSSGGWSYPQGFDTGKQPNPTSTSWKITDVVGNTDSSTRTYEITVHNNYSDGTVNLESNMVKVVVTGSSAQQASSLTNYGFASVFDETLESLFNIFK